MICFSFSSFSQTGMLNGTGYAPDFTVTDINGTSHTLYDYLDSGFVVVLELLSVTCSHCQAYAAGTENSYQTNGPNGSNVARFLGLEVNSSTDSTDIANFMSNNGVTFPIADNVSPSGINYQLYYTPSYFVVYPDSSYTTLCPAYCVTTSSWSTIENLLNTAISAWIPPVYGCMDASAINYDSTANTDNNSCVQAVTGCMDQNAWNYNVLANVGDSGSCLYTANCVTGPGIPYWLNDPCYAWVIDVDDYCCENEWDEICQATYDYCEGTWIGPLPKRYDKKLIMITDILGRPVSNITENKILFFIYDDNSVEKKLITNKN